jgi:tRNA-modifying protein YgfZ
VLRVSGRDRTAFLHGLLSNEVRTLNAGSGCYATWLTPQGRMITDLHVFETGEQILLDVPRGLAPALLQRLDQCLFSEDVRLADAAETLVPIGLHGADAASVLQEMLGTAAPFSSWPDYQHAGFAYASGTLRLARIDQLGVPGWYIYAAAGDVNTIEAALQSKGATPLDAATITAARVEAGYPVFGVDMTTDTIPLEAGIEDRAISFTKGCYVGQEVIVRVMHRGGGRVARRLMALRFDGTLPEAGAKLFNGDREAGWVTSVAVSPRLGPIGMGYVHRDWSSPGVRLSVGAASAAPAVTVSERPIRDGR